MAVINARLLISKPHSTPSKTNYTRLLSFIYLWYSDCSDSEDIICRTSIGAFVRYIKAVNAHFGQHIFCSPRKINLCSSQASTRAAGTVRKMTTTHCSGSDNQSVAKLVCSTDLVQSTANWGMMEKFLLADFLRYNKTARWQSCVEKSCPSLVKEVLQVWRFIHKFLVWSTGRGRINHRYSFETVSRFTALAAGT